MKTNWFITTFFGWLFKKDDLKTTATKAIASVELNEENVEAARLALANAQRIALANSQRVLDELKAAQTEAEQAEVNAEAARQAQIAEFDKTTTAEVEALEKALAALKTRRANEKNCLEGELNAERTEAAQQDQAATDAEAEIALRIEALREGKDAQNGLNDGLQG